MTIFHKPTLHTLPSEVYIPNPSNDYAVISVEYNALSYYIGMDNNTGMIIKLIERSPSNYHYTVDIKLTRIPGNALTIGRLNATSILDSMYDLPVKILKLVPALTLVFEATPLIMKD